MQCRPLAQLIRAQAAPGYIANYVVVANLLRFRLHVADGDGLVVMCWL